METEAPLTPETLRRERRKLRLTVYDLGALMGVSGDYVSKLERRKRAWSPAVELRATRALARVREGGGEVPSRPVYRR